MGTIPRRGGGGWLGALLSVAAILVIVALMAPMTRGMLAPPADTGEVGPGDAKAGVVGSAIVHDDTGIMHASMVDEGAGAAVIHDDAGNVR